MEWFQALIMGLVQGLTEFLPVSSSGHLAIARELLGAEVPEDLMFEVTVHCATVLSTIVVFRKQICKLLSGLFKFKYNDETDYILKICVSMIPVFVVGMFFKDYVEAAFSNFLVVGFALLLTAALLFFSERVSARRTSAPCGSEAGMSSGFDFETKAPCACRRTSERGVPASESSDAAPEVSCQPEKPGFAETASTTPLAAAAAPRGGISYVQAFIVGIGQAFAVIPGLSRSGTTIATGLLCGVKKEVVAQFSFLMVLVPILGEMFLDVVGGEFSASSVGVLPLCVGFVAAFLSGLFACKIMIALVKKAKLKWFALYCAIVGLAVIVFTLWVMSHCAAIASIID